MTEVAEPAFTARTNGQLADDDMVVRSRLREANAKLEAIRNWSIQAKIENE